MTREIRIEPEDIFRILSQGGNDDPPERNVPLPEAQIMTLKELYGAYRTAESYQPGDIVKRRSTIGGPHQARPCIVLEINRHAEPNFTSHSETDAGSNLFGQRHDIRLMMLLDGRACPFWVESYEVEPWTDDDNKGTSQIDTPQGSA